MSGGGLPAKSTFSASHTSHTHVAFNDASKHFGKATPATLGDPALKRMAARAVGTLTSGRLA
jgi:hypothetical protein